ncbi:MAG: hypothetical protein ACRD96_16030, partial [Bryobacteraceae bacterium]
MKHWLQFVVWLVVSGIITIVVVFRYGFTDHLETRMLSRVNEQFEQLWFTPYGQLAGLRRDENDLTVTRWASQNATVEKKERIDLAEYEPGPAGPVAVMRDVSLMAWATPKAVHIRTLGDAGKHHVLRAIPKNEEVRSLAFSETGRLAVLYKNGRLEVSGTGAGARPVAADVEFKNAGPLVGAGSFIAAYTQSGHEAYVFDTRKEDRLAIVEYKRTPFRIESLTLSASGRLALGTD